MIAFVMFLVIFLATDSIINQKNKDFSELSAKEKIDYVNNINEYIQNENNFQAALFNDNRAYCDEITNKSLKKVCYDNVSEYREIPSFESMTQQEIDDENNFQAALFNHDVSLCYSVVNEYKKNNCLNTLS